MFCLLKMKKKYSAYVSKNNANREKQVILLMISNGERWHYLALKKLSALLKGLTSKHDGDYCCLNYLKFWNKKQTWITQKSIRK